MSSTRKLRILGAHVARELEAEGPAPDQLEASRLRLLSAVRRRREVRPVVVRGALVAAACLGIVAAWAALRGPAVLEFRVAGAQGSVGASLPTERRTPVTFADGSRFEVERGARARVGAVTARGARLVLEAGHANVHVVPRPGADWEIAAGPFRIAVTGTRFGVAWSAERDELSVELHEGSVTVEGCHLARPEPLSAGRRLVARCKEPSLSVTPLAAGPSVAPSAVGSLSAPTGPTTLAAPASGEGARRVVEPGGAPAPDSPPGPVTAPVSSAAPASVPSWIELSRAGRFVEGFERASADHVLDRLEALDAGGLLLLGDTARLSGHPAEAGRAYAAVRRRVPGTEQAALAAFSLARLDLDRGQVGSGTRWLEIYLAEAPEGQLSGAALGRLFELSARRGDPAATRDLAARYLARHPDGAHASEARRLLSAPR